MLRNQTRYAWIKILRMYVRARMDRNKQRDLTDRRLRSLKINEQTLNCRLAALVSPHRLNITVPYKEFIPVSRLQMRPSQDIFNIASH